MIDRAWFSERGYRDETEIGKLMHDFCCWDPDDMTFDLMKETARYYKENPEGVEIMCKAFEETRREGAYRAQIETAKRMIADGFIPLDKIAAYCALPLETVHELAGQKTA